MGEEKPPKEKKAGEEKPPKKRKEKKLREKKQPGEQGKEQKEEKITDDIQLAKPENEPETKPGAEEKPKVVYLENPLPLPKQHVSKTLEYDWNVGESEDFDVDISETDDFDI